MREEFGSFLIFFEGIMTLYDLHCILGLWLMINAAFVVALATRRA